MTPAAKIQEEHRLDLISERLEAQRDYLKNMLLTDGVVNIGTQGETYNYTLAQALDEWCESDMFKILAAIVRGRDSQLERHQNLNKLIAHLMEATDRASIFHGKILLGDL